MAVAEKKLHNSMEVCLEYLLIVSRDGLTNSDVLPCKGAQCLSTVCSLRIRALQVLQASWDALYFLFSSTRLNGLYPFVNLAALKNVLMKSKAELDIMADSPYLPGVIRKYEEVESLLGILQERVAMVESCQVILLLRRCMKGRTLQAHCILSKFLES